MVFVSGLTNVRVELTVEDTATGETWTYTQEIVDLRDAVVVDALHSLHLVPFGRCRMAAPHASARGLRWEPRHGDVTQALNKLWRGSTAALQI